MTSTAALQWARRHTESRGIGVANLSDSWADGTAFAALAESLAAASNRQVSLLNSSTDGAAALADRAFAVLSECWGVEPLLDGEDLVDGPDRHSILTYLIEVHKACGGIDPGTTSVGFAPDVVETGRRVDEELSNSNDGVSSTVNHVGGPERDGDATKPATSGGTGQMPADAWSEVWDEVRLADAANLACAECLSKGSAVWASTTLGIFLCIDCVGKHRSAGVHISRTKSCTLDRWTFADAARMRYGGNSKFLEYISEHGGSALPDSRDVVRDTTVQRLYKAYTRCLDANVKGETGFSSRTSIPADEPLVSSILGTDSGDTIADHRSNREDDARLARLRMRHGATGIGSDDLLEHRASGDKASDASCCACSII